MVEEKNVIDEQALETGFWQGVSRAREGGLELGTVINERGALTDMIRDCLNAMEPIEPNRQIWNSRAVKHLADTITTFEIALRNNKKSNSLAIDAETVKKYLGIYLTCGNCWSHH